MKKLAYVLAAVATIAVPAIASAQDYGVRIGGDRDYYYRDHYRDHYRGPRAEYRGPRVEIMPRIHRGYEHDRGVVIRRHSDEY